MWLWGVALGGFKVTSAEPLWRPHKCDPIVREETERAPLSLVPWGHRKKIAMSLEVAICGPQQTLKLASWLWTSWISGVSELHDLSYCVTATDTLCWVPEVEIHTYHAPSVSSLQWHVDVSFVRTKPTLDRKQRPVPTWSYRGVMSFVPTFFFLCLLIATLEGSVFL